MTATLTSAQVQTLKTILSHGGRVVECMGAIKGNRVNKRTIERLEDMGFISVRRLSHGMVTAGPQRIDATVTAVACQILFMMGVV